MVSKTKEEATAWLEKEQDAAERKLATVTRDYDEEPGDCYGVMMVSREPVVLDDSWMQEAYNTNNW